MMVQAIWHFIANPANSWQRVRSMWKMGGTPLAIALSADGQKLAVSSMDIHDGSVKSTVSFYNFLAQ